MAQYPAASTIPNRLITKPDTAGQTNLTATSVVTTASATPGTWVQLTASSSVEYLLVGFQYQTTVGVGNTTLMRSDLPIVVDIGTGGAGSETVKATGAVGNVGYDGTNLEISGIYNFAIPLRISASTRVAVRAAKSNNNGAATVTGIINIFVVSYANVEGN